MEDPMIANMTSPVQPRIADTKKSLPRKRKISEIYLTNEDSTAIKINELVLHIKEMLNI